MAGIWLNEYEFIEFSDTTSVNIEALSHEIATRDAAEWLSFLGVLPDPDPVLRKRGDGVEILESLTADAHLESVIGTRKAGTKAREWRIEPGTITGEKPTPAAENLARRFAEDLERIDVENLIVEILNAPLMGNVPIEILWRPGDGRARIHDLRALPSRWFGWSQEDNQPRFLSKENPWYGEELPFGKFVFARYEPTYDNPYGKRLLSRCFWPITFKRGGLQFWVTFCEKFGIPFLLGKYGRNVEKPEQARMLASLAAMVRDAVAIVPEGASVEMLTHKGQGGEVFQKLCDSMDAAMSKVIMGQTLTAEVGDKGSYAAGKVHENVLHLYQASDQKLVKTTFEDIAWLYGQVNAPGVPTPLFCWFEEEDIQKDRAERDNTLSLSLERSGHRLTTAYYKKHYNLEDDDLEPIPAGPEKTDGGEFAEDNSPSESYQAQIDKLIESAISGAGNAFTGNEEKFIRIIQESNSYEEAVEKLLEAYPELETAEFEKILGRALTAADFYGRWTVQEETGNDR